MAETGIAPKSLDQILAARPASVQDCWFARLYLLKPLAILGLALAVLVPSAEQLAAVLGLRPNIARPMLPGAAWSVIAFLAGLGLLVRLAVRCALIVLLSAALVQIADHIMRPWTYFLGPLDFVAFKLPMVLLILLCFRNFGRPLMESILLLKFIHVLGASVLFGTGAGIAFFMLMAHRTGHAGVIAVTARFVVIADFIFTATAVLVQPVSGVALAWAIGLSPLEEPWIVLSILIYIFVGLCWLPVVFIQMRMRNLANDAAINGKPLPDQYRLLFRIWFALGWPAFAGVIAIFALMTWQPRWW